MLPSVFRSRSKQRRRAGGVCFEGAGEACQPDPARRQSMLRQRRRRALARRRSRASSSASATAAAADATPSPAAARGLGRPALPKAKAARAAAQAAYARAQCCSSHCVSTFMYALAQHTPKLGPRPAGRTGLGAADQAGPEPAPLGALLPASAAPLRRRIATVTNESATLAMRRTGPYLARRQSESRRLENRWGRQVDPAPARDPSTPTRPNSPPGSNPALLLAAAAGRSGRE